jgi:hypothetical protein
MLLDVGWVCKRFHRSNRRLWRRLWRSGVTFRIVPVTVRWWWLVHAVVPGGEKELWQKSLLKLHAQLLSFWLALSLFRGYDHDTDMSSRLSDAYVRRQFDLGGFPGRKRVAPHSVGRANKFGSGLRATASAF